MTSPTYADFTEFLREHHDSYALSVYVEGGISDPAQQRAWHVRLRESIAHQRAKLGQASDEMRQAFEACVGRLDARLPSDTAIHQSGSWMCICTETGATFEAILPLHVPTVAAWQRGPLVLPYVNGNLFDSVYVVQIGREDAQILQLRNGALHDVEAFEAVISMRSGTHMGDVPRLGFHPGTVGEPLSEQKQRKQRDARHRMTTDVAQRATRYVRDNGLLVVSGPEEVARHFVRQLPTSCAARARIIRFTRVDAPRHALLSAVLEAVEALQAQRQSEWLVALHERARIGGHVALGPAATDVAVSQGAVESLLVSERYLHTHGDDAERLALRALLQGASVSVAAERVADLVHAGADGVVAELRFALPEAGGLTSPA